MGAQFSQFFPPSPTFTEKDLPSLKDRVFLITGGTSGIGLELSKILYHAGGKVYITGRTEEKATRAVQMIRDSAPHSTANHSPGQIDSIILNLDDLASIKASADAFKRKESRIDVLWNNAGVSQPPLGTVSKQGYELQLATNCYGPFLFTQLLLPLLEVAVTSSSSPGSVRAIWLSSQVAELSSPREGLVMSEIITPPKDNVRNYTNSKTGNWLLSAELARRYGGRGIVSIALNPGAANSNLLRNAWWMKFLSYPLLHRSVQAAYTELYAGLSDDISLENNGCYVIPWGRIHHGVAANLLNAMNVVENGGTGQAKEFWEFCEETVKPYL
ncbi:hypothetical protein BDV06DRAFT_207079 [Aspergillus oleicola]